MKLSKKLLVATAVGFFAGLGNAQTVQEGIASVDSHKYAKAREIFSSLISQNPKEGENYFYLGDTYLTQSEPNFDKAEEQFKKGLEVDSKSYVNKIGLASIKLGKGDKSAISEIQSIVSDTREKDPEVLYRAAEALTMYDKYNAPDLAIDYLNKAIERATMGGVPSYYYYTLGDAYRLKKQSGDAMTAYDKAAAVASNKASVFTRMGTLWMAAQQWKLAKENLDKAVTVDPTYAPVYKALAGYDIRYQENAKATQDLIKYSQYADEDPYTQLEIAKLYFTADDYIDSKKTLDKIFDKVDDPIKYKLKAYLDYNIDSNYADGKANLDKFFSEVKDQSRIMPSDKGLDGLLTAGLAMKESDEATKSSMIAQANQKIAQAKAAKDETMDWDMELAKTLGGGGITQEAVDAGPSNAQIEALKAKLKANPNDTDALYNLANEYQNVQNWNGAILTWKKMSALLPTWAPAYYSQGYSYQQAGNDEMAKHAYQDFIDTVLKQPVAEQAQSNETMSYAYFAVAYMSQTTDPEKARDYVAKALQLNPTYEDAINLNKALNQ